MTNHSFGPSSRGRWRTWMAALLLTVAPTATAAAQDLPRVRVTRGDTTIRAMRYNQHEIWRLMQAEEGAVFEVLDVDGDDTRYHESNYYLVLLPRDPWGTQWVGWIPGRSVELAPPRERAAAASSTEPMMVTYGNRRPAPPAVAPARAATPAPDAAAARVPAPAPEVVLHFAFDRSELTEAAKTTLETALRTSAQSLSFALAGHADATGTETYNQKLGLARAEAVRTYIIDQLQVPEDRITVTSLGETQPAASNDTQDGRAENRRVVVQVSPVATAIGN